MKGKKEEGHEVRVKRDVVEGERKGYEMKREEEVEREKDFGVKWKW